MLIRIDSTKNNKLLPCTKSSTHVYYIFDYKNEEIQQKVFQIKKGEEASIEWVSAKIFNIILDSIDTDSKNPRIGILPIPSRSYYRREKNKDQMFQVAKSIKSKFKSIVRKNTRCEIIDCLIPLNLSQQKSLSKEDRESREKNMFIIDPIIRAMVNQKKITHLWIIDDVITTGTTLRSAINLALQKINAKQLFVIGITH